MKKLLNHIFIDGLSGMALGLFSTLIVGTIIQQIGNLIGGNIGDMLFIMGKMAAAMTGAGIGVGVAHRYQESPLVVLSVATAGMTGGFASKILAGSLLVDGSVVLAGPGEPLGAFVAAFAGIELGHLVSGKTSRYSGNADRDDRNRMCSRSDRRTADFQIYDRTWCNHQLGNRTAAIYHGNRGFRADGNDPDTADQFCGSWYYFKSFRTCSRCGDDWMLL